MAVEETEYAGFVPTQPINWASLAQDLAGKVYNIGEERQKKREELDKIAADNQSMLNSWQPGKNQTFNQAVLRGADQGRVLIKQWNDDLKAGLISATDYRNKMNNMKEYWGILAQTAKTYDDRYLEIIKRQTPDENGKIQASSFEIDMFDELAKMSNLSQSATQWDYDGRLYMANTDPNNGKIKGNIYDVRTVNLPDNIIANRVNVDDQVNGVVKNWDTKTLFEKAAKGGELTIESAKNQDSYKIMVERLANTIAPDNNPRAQISVLADNGVITPYYYKTDQEYKAIKEQQINDLRQLKIDAGATDISLTEKELYDIEISLVRKVQDSNGLFMPVLTDEQKKLARERVKESIDIQLAERIQKDMPNISTGGGTPTTKDNSSDIAGYKSTLRAFGIDENAIKQGETKSTGKYDFSGLSRSYQYKKVPGGVAIYKAGDMMYDPNTSDASGALFIAKNPRDLAQYVFGGQDASKSSVRYEKARQSYLQGVKPRSTGNNNDPLDLGI